MDHIPFSELRRIAEYSADPAAILDAIDALERAEPIAEAAREFVRCHLAWVSTGREYPYDKWNAFIAAVEAERADREARS